MTLATISTTLGAVPRTLGTISMTLAMIPRTLGAVATTIEMISTTMAAVPMTLGTVPTTLGTVPTTLGTVPTTLGTAPTTLGTIPMTLGSVPTTKETSATVKETPSRVTEMTPSWQVMGGGKREFHRAKDAKAAKSQRDAMTIAQPFMAGSGVNKMKKSREGRQKNRVAVRNGGRAQAPFVPDGTLDDCGHRVPAMNGWAIFKDDEAASGAAGHSLSGNAQTSRRRLAMTRQAVGEISMPITDCLWRDCASCTTSRSF